MLGIALLAEIVGIILVATNRWKLRQRLPWYAGASLMRKAFAWVGAGAVTFATFVGWGATLPPAPKQAAPAAGPTVAASVTLTAAVLSAQPSASASGQSGRGGPLAAYPLADLTPGATDPAVTQDNINSTICVSGYPARVRPAETYTEQLKAEQIKLYGYADTKLADYEEDHFIPLELGGNPKDPKNLWPEPYSPAPGSHEKDKVENYLREQVCSGVMTLQAAREAIRTDWVAVYQRMLAITPSVNSPSAAAAQLAEATATPASAAAVSASPAATAPAPPAATPAVVATSPPASPISGSTGTGHTWYLSSYRSDSTSGSFNAHLIYCDTDPGWQKLSKSYLQTFQSLSAAKSADPNYTLAPTSRSCLSG